MKENGVTCGHAEHPFPCVPVASHIDKVLWCGPWVFSFAYPLVLYGPALTPVWSGRRLPNRIRLPIPDVLLLSLAF